MKIKSIYTDFVAFNPVAAVDDYCFPYEQTRDQLFMMIVGAAGDQFAYPFTNIAGGVPASNGDRFFITRPGQIKFDSFFIKNELNFAFTMINRTSATWSYDISMVVETSERSMFIQ